MPPIESLEALGDAFAALEAPVERKRMLVIVNPYATTVSDRLKSLVVYALQGRYEVDAADTEGRDHATELCREAADEGYDVVVAFGGDGTVNEAANGLAGSATPLTVPARRRDRTSTAACSASRTTSSTPPSTCCASPTTGARARSTSASVNGRHFMFSAGFGLDAAVVRRVDAHPRIEDAPAPLVLHAGAAISTFTREYVVHPPQLDVHAGGEVVRGVTVVVQNGDPYTYFGRPADPRRRGHRPRRRHASPAPCCAARRRSTCPRSRCACSPSA